MCVDMLQVGSSLLPARACWSQVVGRPSEQETRLALAAVSLHSSLCASAFMHSPETPWKDNPSRAEGLVQSCRAILHYRTGHQGLKSMSEELGEFRAPHKWECLTVQGEALWDSVPLRLVCGPSTQSCRRRVRSRETLQPLTSCLSTSLQDLCDETCHSPHQ